MPVPREYLNSHPVVLVQNPLRTNLYITTYAVEECSVSFISKLRNFAVVAIEFSFCNS